MNCCAIILAAGRGSRMGSLTDDLPKGLIGRAGFTTFESQLENLSKVKIDQIGVVTGYQAHHYEKFNVRSFLNSEWYASNMVYSLSKAFDWAGGFDKIIVSYADIFFSLDIFEKIFSCSSDIAIAYDVNWLETWRARFDDPLEDAETFRMDHNNNLLEIGKKPKTTTEVEGQYMGLTTFSKKGWKQFFDFIFNLNIDEQKRIDMTGALDLFQASSLAKIKCIPFEGSWGEIDSKSDLELYFSKILKA